METTKYNTNTNTAKHSGALWVQFGCSLGAVLQNCTQTAPSGCCFAKLHQNSTKTAPKMHPNCTQTGHILLMVFVCVVFCCFSAFVFLLFSICVDHLHKYMSSNATQIVANWAQASPSIPIDPPLIPNVKTATATRHRRRCLGLA